MNNMFWFRKKKKEGEGDKPDLPPHTYPVPEESTVLGTDGNYTDSRVFVRNVVYDAMLGSEVAEEYLAKVFDMPSVSPEGQEALLKDSKARLAKVLASHKVIDAVVDTVVRIMAEIKIEYSGIPVEDDLKEAAIYMESDVARRTAIATVAALVDLGLLVSKMEPIKVVYLNELTEEDLEDLEEIEDE